MSLGIRNSLWMAWEQLCIKVTNLFGAGIESSDTSVRYLVQGCRTHPDFWSVGWIRYRDHLHFLQHSWPSSCSSQSETYTMCNMDPGAAEMDTMGKAVWPCTGPTSAAPIPHTPSASVSPGPGASPGHLMWYSPLRTATACSLMEWPLDQVCWGKGSMGLMWPCTKLHTMSCVGLIRPRGSTRGQKTGLHRQDLACEPAIWHPRYSTFFNINDNSNVSLSAAAVCWPIKCAEFCLAWIFIHSGTCIFSKALHSQKEDRCYTFLCLWVGRVSQTKNSLQLRLANTWNKYGGDDALHCVSYYW